MDTRIIEYKLSQKYGYKKLPEDLSEKYHDFFLQNIPEWLKQTNKIALKTINGTQLCTSYDRIVVGDYGAFIEFSKNQACTQNFIIAPGQEYRINDPKYADHCKYEWYTIDDGSNVKIYKQKRRVSYADYIPGKYYINVHEVFTDICTRMEDS